MKVAIITGASSGLGREYALCVDKDRNDIDEIWLIARRAEKLEELAKELKKQVKILPFDITDQKNIEEYVNILNETKPQIVLLINNAGFGKLDEFVNIKMSDSAGMIKLNCEALTVMSAVTIPFMENGGEIINTCSIASFAPTTRMAVYGATKSYVMSFSRSLRSELKKQKINVLAVCPGPMDTEFLPVAGIGKGVSHTFDTLPRVKAPVVAKKSLKASKKGRGVYTNLFLYKFYRIIAKILPHSIVMKMCGT